jgi:hypothetical protein
VEPATCIRPRAHLASSTARHLVSRDVRVPHAPEVPVPCWPTRRSPRRSSSLRRGLVRSRGRPRGRRVASRRSLRVWSSWRCPTPVAAVGAAATVNQRLLHALEHPAVTGSHCRLRSRSSSPSSRARPHLGITRWCSTQYRLRRALPFSRACPMSRPHPGRHHRAHRIRVLQRAWDAIRRFAGDAPVADATDGSGPRRGRVCKE